MPATNAEVKYSRPQIVALATSSHPVLNVQATPWIPLKVAVEWAIALLFLLPIAVVLALLAMAVMLTSPGGAFYQQRRVGRNGKIFTMIKLRTMSANCEDSTGAVWSRRGDPRVTGIGRLLRDTHLDELPQIWNVIRGEMSLIGPRPERPEIVPELALMIPNYMDRLAVRPGLTGLAQVELPPDESDVDVRHKLAYDRFYIEHATPLLDLRIVLSTCLFMFSSALEALRHAVVRSYGRRVEADYAKAGVLNNA